ncbi:inner membrane protein [Yoonia tamlensis]|uniref:Inner membrane protein n=1 Tax=Yoonia tamlensis TaxID=390270 RepID=A0A1I6GX88_9RHOB|nr:cell envelope integrity protein CreD [Yoonia tamlensis]SFR46864.1 inner membrane protein [Yoonia tamlensis]
MKSPGARFLIVGVLALFMYIPLAMVGEVVKSRADYSRETVRSVGAEWGGRQMVNGPVLILPVQGPVTRKETRDVVDPRTGQVSAETYEVTSIVAKSPIYILPDRYDVTVQSTSEVRRRGVFEVPVYSAELRIDFDFVLDDLETDLAAGEEILWDRGDIQLGLSANKALRGAASLRAGARDLRLEPTTGEGLQGIRSATGDPRGVGGYQLVLGFNGAESLSLTPVGRSTNVTMTSDWPHPSFDGAYLPNARSITEDGFVAEWAIPHLARNLPQVSRENPMLSAQRAGFGVRYYQPNDFYQKAYRAAKYGILFIALTFLTVMLIEMGQSRRAHPVQYILIGLAQAIFSLLMVAYAEQIGFAAAYGLASAATIGLLVIYGITGLRLGRRVWIFGTMLVVLYGLLYMILRSADYALLAGATLAFAALAGTMIATRNEDWHGNGGSGRWFARKAKPSPDSPQ